MTWQQLIGRVALNGTCSCIRIRLPGLATSGLDDFNVHITQTKNANQPEGGRTPCPSDDPTVHAVTGFVTHKKAGAAPIVFVVLFWNVKYQPSSQEQWLRLAWRNPATWRSLLFYLFAHRRIFTFSFFNRWQMIHFPVISSCTDQSTPTASVITRLNVQILSRTSYCGRNTQSEHGSSDGFCWSIISFLRTHAVPHYW